MFVRATVSVLGILAATTAFGSDAEGKFAVRGIGGQTCNIWTTITASTDEAARRDGILAFQAWIAGYLTATNRLKTDAFDAVPFLDMINILAITMNECKAQPDELVENTLARVVAAFDKAKVTAESPIVMVPDAGAQKPYRQATIQLAQQKLVDLGYLDSQPDGVLGPMTTEALILYQTQNGLTSNGELSVDTMFKLLLQ